MEMGLLSIVLQLILASVATHYLLTLLKRSKLNPKRLPPGPLPLPIVGNLFSLGAKPHKSLLELARVHGPAMLLKLGYSHTLVISSPSAARDVLKTNDVAFSGRNVMQAGTAVDHHLSSLVLLPPDARWRAFRKICTTQVFANSRLDATQGLRRKKVQLLINYVQKCSNTEESVNIGQAAFVTTLNSLTNTFFSMDMVDLGSKDAGEFKDLIWAIMVQGGASNIADFFPILQAIDPQGIKRRTVVYFKRLIQIFDSIINERQELRKTNIESARKNDVLDALLDLSGEVKEFRISDIPHLLIDLFVAGTDTTSSTLEWAMTELLRNPEKMKKAQSELEEVIGVNNAVEESDYHRLPYLRAIVKETLRVHPPTPFLVPRMVFTETKLNEFTIPKRTKVLINVWAMGRDPKLWPNVDAFEPERFLESSIDFVGQDYELIPFGSGRRVCPGMPLANRMMHWMLASMIHSVGWKLEGGLKPEDVDVDDKFGFSLQKAHPMIAIPTPRQK